MCYILCMCVCVGASDTTTAEGFGATPRNFFLGGYLLFLADFAIFS
jgi:hypothetical protein